LYARGEAVDNITVAAELQRSGKLEEIGGRGYLTQLVALTPSTANAKDYAIIVDNFAWQRRALDLASDIAKYSKRPKKLREILSRASIQFGPRRNGKPLDFLTADEILTREWPEPNWAVPQMLPAGLTILAGKARSARAGSPCSWHKPLRPAGWFLGSESRSDPSFIWPWRTHHAVFGTV